MDTLTVTGVGRRVDGTYECDVVSLIDVSSPDALTVREAEQIKALSGARGGEIAEAFLAGDQAVRMALALVVLKRAGKQLDADEVWDKPIGALTFTLGAIAEQPADPPTVEGGTPSTSGGGSGGSTSENLAEDRSLTGAPV